MNRAEEFKARQSRAPERSSLREERSDNVTQKSDCNVYRKFSISIFNIDTMSGDDGGGDTPVPIPNTAVKPSSADGTCPEGDRESRTLPGRQSLRIAEDFAP